MKLTTKEKLRLLGEALITAGLLVLVYLATYQILRWYLRSQMTPEVEVWLLGDVLLMVRENSVLSTPPIVIFVLLIPGALFIYWRLRRRYRLYELNHIIDELHYIAEGNYAHRIRGNFDKELQDVVDSIHLLVDSTVEAMEEERRIEQTKDELITNVSHDIRTPLTSIIGYLDLVEKGRYQNEEELEQYVHIAYEKAQQMKLLVDDLFEYTTVNQGKDQLQITRFDMIQLLEQLQIDFQIELDQKNMAIELQTESEHLEMTGDPNRLVRVFNNLFSNAIKYGTPKTTILVDVRQEETRSGQEYVVIAITNEGKEISERGLRQVFDRFYRDDSARTQTEESSGIGLAIAKSIVDAHHGTIVAQSDRKATTFTIRLPRNHYIT